MKPTLLIYGNCQAAALRVIFSANPVIAEQFRVLYVPSFDDRIVGAELPDDDAIRLTSVFFDQNDKTPFPNADALPADCVRITFPSIDLNLLWPLHCINIFNDVPTPERLWGSFPYGDRVIVERVNDGASVTDAIRYYHELSASDLPNLSRFEKLEYARLKARDAKCDVPFADYVFETFRTENLFWCVNHPTMTALRELSHRLIDAVRERSTIFQTIQIDDTIETLHPDGPLNFIRVPVHPALADSYDLKWYPRDEVAHYGLRENRLSYDDYFQAMAECSVRVREEKKKLAVAATGPSA